MAEHERGLDKSYSRLGIWAFSIGTSIGWGSFVVTCSTYLAQAGPLGTILGLIVGMAIILVITRNLCYAIERNPDPGGIYTYGTVVRGHDMGFMIAWILLLTYLAILWANITSLPLFARRFFGGFFQFGYCYTIFGYEVYIGEVLLSVTALLLVSLLCMRSKKIPQLLMVIMSILFVGVVTLCSVIALIRHPGTAMGYDPLYIPDKGAIRQIVRIAVISPWAFIGFENAAHFSGEYRFPVKKVRGVLLISVIMSTAFYILMTLLSVTAYPSEYPDWLSYIRDMNNLGGIKALPAFYAVEHYMGQTGVTLMMVALLSVVLTSIIANLTALSRLLYALGRDKLLPGILGELNTRHIPGNAMLFVAAVSCFIPFLGRTAIGWIVDVTTLGATIIYGFMSYVVFRDARTRNDRTEKVTGLIGTLVMVGFAILLLAPKLMTYEAMPSESYLLFSVWSVLGLIVFRIVLNSDREHIYGKSIIVWIMMLLLMLLTTMMWVSRGTQVTTENAMTAIMEYYSNTLGIGGDKEKLAAAFIEGIMVKIENANARNTLISFGLFVLAVVIMFDNHFTSRKREKEWQEELGVAREIGNVDPLTGVKSRHSYTRMEEHVNIQIDNEEVEPFAVVVCDINDLKWINDNLGHDAGDEYIKNACRAICKIFKHSPVFRFGGDEFVVFLQHEDYENREELLKEINDLSEQNNGTHKGVVVATGIAEYRKGDDSLLSVFSRADGKMYERKRYLKSLVAS